MNWKPGAQPKMRVCRCRRRCHGCGCSLRGVGPGQRWECSVSFLSDELIERASMAAMSDVAADAKSLDALRSAGQAIRDLQAIGKQDRMLAKAMTELVGSLPHSCVDRSSSERLQRRGRSEALPSTRRLL